MKRNTVIDLLCLLSGEEVTKLGKFLRSPYFNSSKPVVALFDCLRKWHPDYEEKRIRPQIFWKKIYPGEEFAEQKYWTLNFNLRCLIERFMAVEEMQNDDFAFKKQLIQSHGRRNAHALFEKETKALVGQLEKLPYQDIYSYSKSLWLKHDYFFNPLTDKYGGAVYSVEDAMEDLDRFYLLAKLRFAAEIKNRERIFSQKVPLQLMEETIATSSKYVPENPAYLMYRNVLDLYDPEKAENAFRSGKELLGQQFSRLSKHDQNEVMLNMRNYAIRELNKGRTEFWKELLDLYKLGLELELIVISGRIAESDFGNIVKVGCVNKAFDWTLGFIKEFEKFLDPQIRDDAKILSLATIHFTKKEYSESIGLLENHKFSQVLNYMSGRSTLIKCWFELFLKNHDLFSLMLSKIEADEKLFRREISVSEERKSAHINFILTVKKLINAVISRKKKSVKKEEMIIYLDSKTPIVSMDWINEKISKL